MDIRHQGLPRLVFLAALGVSFGLAACSSSTPKSSNTSAGLENTISPDDQTQRREGDQSRAESEMNGRSAMHNEMPSQARDGQAMGARRMGMGPDSADNTQAPADPGNATAAPMKDDM
jgi:hypothetical protein